MRNLIEWKSYYEAHAEPVYEKVDVPPEQYGAVSAEGVVWVVHKTW